MRGGAGNRRAEYFRAIRELAEIGAAEVLRAEEAETLPRAMPIALQDTQINAPWADRLAVLVGHHAGELMQVSQIVDRPGGQKFR